MRVALDASAVPTQVAGAGRYVVEIARRLPAVGVDLVRVTRRDDAARWRTWSPTATVEALVPTARVARLTYEAWRLGQSRAAKGATVWHGPHYTMPHHGATPTVVTIHDLTFFTHPQFHERAKAVFFRRAIEYAAGHAHVLICVSDVTARQLDELVPEHAPVVVAPHGVDLERFSLGAAGAARPDPGPPFLLFLGTIEPRKGLATLLAAFAEIARTVPEVELWLAGQAGWGGDLDGLIAHHEALPRIRRLGFVDDDDLPDLLRRARAVVYPSFVEGFGLPVLEAMACGAVVVTSTGTVMADVAGATALLCPAGDVTALAGTVLAALGLDDVERRRIAVQARARAEQFTWTASVERHLAAYALASGS